MEESLQTKNTQTYNYVYSLMISELNFAGMFLKTMHSHASVSHTEVESSLLLTRSRIFNRIKIRPLTVE